MIEKHVDGFLALLPAGPPYFYTEKVPDETDPETSPYVRFYFDQDRSNVNFASQPHEFALNITAHCVGGSALAAMRVSDWLDTAILAKIPTVAGRKCWPIRWDSGSPPRSDESTGRDVLDQVNVYVLRSVPAS